MKKVFGILVLVSLLSGKSHANFDGILVCGDLNIYINEIKKISTVNGEDFYLESYPETFNLSLKQEKKPDNYIGRVRINRILGFASIQSWKRQTDGNWQVRLIQVDCKEKKRKF